MVNISLAGDIFNVFIIRTEAEPFRIGIVLHNALDDHLQIARGAALPDMAGHTHGTFLHHILVSGSLVIRGDPGNDIGRQLLIRKIRGMPVLDLAVKKLNLFVHRRVPVDHGHAVHHLAQTENPAVVQILLHLLRVQRTAIIINWSGGNTGGNHHIDMRRQILCLGKQIINAVCAGDVCHLMRIHNKGRGSVLLRLIDQHLRIDKR